MGIRIDANTVLGARRLGVIAGPCVIEDAGMCLEVAAELRRIAARLELPLLFKASYAKANRTSRDSYRGPGREAGLEVLARVRAATGLPVLADVHEAAEVEHAAAVLDVLQIPAFLCRQTPLLEAAAAADRPVNLKKGQFMAPAAMAGSIDKLRAAGCPAVLLTERGTTFGYGDLVVDMRSIPILRGLGVPVVFDVTHSLQQPGGAVTGGRREFAAPLGRAAVAAGAEIVFLETHPDPGRALSDAATQLPLTAVEDLLRQLAAVRETTLALDPGAPAPGASCAGEAR